MKRREKKEGGGGKRRSTSKSPRNSRVIPGVRISELKLKTKKEVSREEAGGSNLKESMTETLTPANVGRLQQLSQVGHTVE